MITIPNRAGRVSRWFQVFACGAELLACSAHAYESPGMQAKIPPHAAPWVEQKQPGLHTVWLWKFSSAADAGSDIVDLLEGGDPTKAATDDRGALAQVSTAAKNSEPTLRGGARATAGSGRFGGGLELDGTGGATGNVPLAELLTAEGGFTLDFWFKPAALPAATSMLCAMTGARGQALFSVGLTADQRVTLAVDAQERLAVPIYRTVGQWHHLALGLHRTPAAPGAPERLTLTLIADGQTATATQPDWLKDLAKRLGTQVSIGGGPAQAGLRGVVDEVRLTKGVFYLYPWNRGTQERPASPPAADVKPPFFRGGKVLTRFHFDGDLAPEAFGGLSWTGTVAAAHFQPGIQGQALDLSHIDQAGFRLNGYYILPEKDGTIEFWFRPLDWNNFYMGDMFGGDVKRDVLLTLTAKDSPGGRPTKDIQVLRGRAGRDGNLHWHEFHPGTWTHVLIVMKNGGEVVYLNGRRQKVWQTVYALENHPPGHDPIEDWRQRTGGKDDGTWTVAFKPSPTLVDEFSVYAWPLSESEAWNAYARWLPPELATMKPLPPVQVDFEYFAPSSDREEKLVATLACLPVNNVSPASADFELRAADGTVLLAAAKQALDGAGNATLTLKQKLPFGHYPVIVRARDQAGAVIKEEQREYVREKPAWFGNTLGNDRTVPAPWTPMQVNGTQLQIVGRTIELGTNGLPARIETLKQSVLQSPATIRATSASGTGLLAGAGIRFTATAPDRVAWQSRLTGAGLTADLDAWMEFDGLLYCAVTLKPAGAGDLRLDELTIEFPLNPQKTTQLIANGGGADFRNSWVATMIPAGTGRVWDSLTKPNPGFCRAVGVSNYMPHIWLGGDDVGLYFGGENDQGWTVDGDRPAQEVRREHDAVVMRLNVIRAPVTITPKGQRFHFLLLPTPAKPEPPDWRKQMATGGVLFGAVDSFGGFDMKTDPADPDPGDSFRLEPRSWDRATAMAAYGRAKWGRSILYADASWPLLGPAFHDWGHDLSAGTGRTAWTPEFEDYAVWAIHEYLQRGLIDGVYWDDVSAGSTLSLDSTAYPCAASENGRRVGFTTLAQRRVNLRLWRLFQAAGKEPAIWAHMTFCYEVPLFSFCRYLSNGEIFSGVTLNQPRDAMDCWTPETLRILGGPAKWGVGVSFLTTLPRQLPPTPAATQWAYPQVRTEDALFLTENIFTVSGGLLSQLNREGIFQGPLRVWPWWQTDEVLRLTTPPGATVLAGVYAGADRAIVFVANHDRDKPHEVSIALDASRLFPGAPPIVWRDLDPGLQPPRAVVASAAEKAALQPGAADDSLLRDNKPASGAELDDLLAGTTPEGRALQALVLRVEGTTAHVLIRPRDYRVLEARPKP